MLLLISFVIVTRLDRAEEFSLFKTGLPIVILLWPEYLCKQMLKAVTNAVYIKNGLLLVSLDSWRQISDSNGNLN